MKRLVARAANAKGRSRLYGMPGGSVRETATFGQRFLVAGPRVWCAREETWYFPVQVNYRGGKMSILWASEAGFTIEEA